MKRKSIFSFWTTHDIVRFIAVLVVCLFIPLLTLLAPRSALTQMTDTCTNGKVLVMDATNKRYKCISADLPLLYRSKTVSINAGANTDAATITGLPARYIVRRITFENASSTPTLATVGVFTGAGGTGTTVVTAQALSSLNAVTVFLDATLAISTTVLTSSSLTIRNIVAAGSAMTVDVTIEVTPLT